MQRTQISRTSSSDKLNDSSSSRNLIHNIDQTNEHKLPLNIKPITHRTIHTQTTQDIKSSFPSKSIPSFAETQLISVYYPSQNPTNLLNNDKCIFIEQQYRQPIHCHRKYDPLSLTKSTQTSPLLTPLSTHSSTLIIYGNEKFDPNYKQRFKIYSGNQNLSNDFNNEYTSSNELIEDSNYTYEEYILNLDEKQSQTTSTSSSSSVTTVIARNNEFNTLSTNNNQRISSWPSVPDDIIPIDNQYENNEQKRLSHIQCSENLIHQIPTSTTNSLIDINSHNISEQLQQFDYHPINQSKWIQTHMDKTDNQTNLTTNRVSTLRTLFEQKNKSEENLSKYNDEIHFHTKDHNISTIHHAEPAQIIQHRIDSSSNNTYDNQSIASFKLDQIRLITGRSLNSLNDVGHYLQDGHTWQWNEIFWLSLTNSQRDHLKDLEYQLHTHKNDSKCSSPPSLSTNERKRLKSTINITGDDTWQQYKPQRLSSNITKYSEINPPINMLNSTTSNITDLKINSQESNNPITIIEDLSTNSIYSNKTNIDDTLNYEEFIYDYLSTYGKHVRLNDNTLILFIDNQQIHLPLSINNNLILTKNIYLDFIDQDLLPFETESNQLVIFIYGEPIILPNDRWLFYRIKYYNAQWIHKLKRINRHIPSQLIPIIEQWLADHTKLLFDTHKLNVDDLIIPLKGKLGLHIIDLYKRQQLETNYWNEILKYLIRIGHVSYDSNEKLIRIAHSELDARRILKSPSFSSLELIERIAKYLRTLDNIHIENDSLYLTDNFILPNEYINDLLIKHRQGENLNANELAHLLLDICHIDEDKNNQILILTFNKQILEIKNNENFLNKNDINILIEWLNKLKQQNLIEITKQNDIIINFNNQNNNSKQQIFIKNEHINTYMKTNNKQTDIINTNDIANILFLYNYIQYSSGKFIFPMENTKLNTTDELIWLQSIIHSIQSNEHKQQTEIELFDGQNTQLLQIPYEYMLPTNNIQTITNYLYQNGDIRYDNNTGNYIYRYISSNENKHLIEDNINQHQLLSSHIKHIHINKNNKSIELEFIHDSNHYLLLPSNWYQQILEHQFNRSYIIDMLLSNGGIFNNDYFIFNNYSYSLKSLNDLSLKQKENLIDYYVDYINNQGEIKYDNINHLLILENLLNGSKLYLTSEHTQFIHNNQYRREDMKFILIKYSQLKQDEFNNWLLYYNNQCIQIPSINILNENKIELINNYHKIIDYMYNHNLIRYNKNLKIFQIYFSNQILIIPFKQLKSIINIKNFNLLNKYILPFNSYQLSQWLLNNLQEINYFHNNSIEILYQNKFYYLPLNYLKQQENFIDTKLKLIFPFNKSLRFIQKTPSTTTLENIEQPSIENNYTIDPLLILANHIHHSSTIYQDQFGRLVIKLNKNEIVIPRIDAIDSIEAINISPQRTGNIIARLINRIGKVQSNDIGGLIITIGKNSFELSKETINYSNKLFNKNNSNLSLLRHAKSTSNLSSSSSIEEYPLFNDDQQILYTKNDRDDTRYLKQDHRYNIQTNLDLKPSILIIPDNETIPLSNRTTRFYIQYTDEYDRLSLNSNLNSMKNQYPIRSIQPQLISPYHYQNITLREAPVYLYKQDNKKIFYENLAHYLSIEQSYLSSRTIRHMLKFTSSDEYFNYLSKKMSTIHAKQLVQESEELLNKQENLNLINKRSISQETFSNIQNDTRINMYEEQQNNHYNFS
ncbi:unnamed protein product [Rotaria sordida]|uniref:Uncharacterized protein n=1 Tax=Rotaria sordida TaxID=392033 RepID=A0A818R8G6_9BILA|nr:unnamed protein product [Rotaria sordida]